MIKGTPRQNSIKLNDEYFIVGREDLLPKANIIPIGKQNIKQKNETINVKDNPALHALRFYRLICHRRLNLRIDPYGNHP